MKKLSRQAVEAGFTILEVLIAVSLLVLFVGVTLMSFQALSGAHLRKETENLQTKIGEVYEIAALSGKGHRIAFNFEERSYWIEVAQGQVRLGEKRLEVSDGAVRDDEDDDDDEDEKAIKAFKGKSEFKPLSEDRGGGKVKLSSSVRIHAFWAEHLEERVRSGVAYLYFFPDGHAEEAQITLSDDEEGNSKFVLFVRPLIGDALIKDEEKDFN